MNILDLKAADFGGAIAHVAATQLFSFFGDDEDGEQAEPKVWFSGAAPDDPSVETDVLEMARYVNGRDIPAEQLWRWGIIAGIVWPGGDNFRDLPAPRRMAFELFTHVCARAHHVLDLAQLDARRLIPFDAPPTIGLKLEDSIFEPHGSLADQEPYQRQYLEDEARRQLLVDIARAAAENAQSAGQPIEHPAGTERPASISLGQREATDEKDPAEAGQMPGGTPAADPEAQGAPPGGDDDLLPSVPAPQAGDDDAAGRAPGADGAVAATVAQPAAPEDAAAAAQSGADNKPVKAKKPAKGKSAT